MSSPCGAAAFWSLPRRFGQTIQSIESVYAAARQRCDAVRVSRGCEMRMKRNMSPIAIRAALLVAGMLACSSASAKGHGEVLVKCVDGAKQLRIATYQEPGPGTTDRRVGLVAISAPSAKIAIALQERDLGLLLGLLKQARTVQSTSWKIVGSVTEAPSSDRSELTISAGPGVQLMISSPRRGSLSFTVASEDLVEFERAMLKMRDFLDARRVAVGSLAGSVRHVYAAGLLADQLSTPQLELFRIAT
jgi:hypothetical protein